ncbi:hypothetical protein EZV62_012371 [Acer yangbiense]|uniref:DUF4283 domain-containing protein n=1 Tax=Acer yangbiense TaxID=1000413 RepID=A0A5C7HW43_9ROSI|nr:hypothetical protein EZV62_012371 [Acer yangbiense]
MEADAIAAFCGNMSLLETDGPVQRLQTDLRMTGVRRMALSLIGRIWKVVGSVEIETVTNNVFTFHFHNDEDRYLAREIGQFLGGMIGVVIDVDGGFSGECTGKYLRVCVRVDMEKPLWRCLRVDVLRGMLKSFKRRWKRKGELPYGAWLRATVPERWSAYRGRRGGGFIGHSLGGRGFSKIVARNHGLALVIDAETRIDVAGSYDRNVKGIDEDQVVGCDPRVAFNGNNKMNIFVFKSQLTVTEGVKAKHLVEAGPLKDGPKEGQCLSMQSKSKRKEIQFIGPIVPTKVGYDIISNGCENGPNEDMVGLNPFNNTVGGSDGSQTQDTGSIKQFRVLSEKEKSKSGCWHPPVRLADRNGHSWSDGDGDGSRDSCGGSKKCKISVEGVENDTQISTAWSQAANRMQ